MCYILHCLADLCYCVTATQNVHSAPDSGGSMLCFMSPKHCIVSAVRSGKAGGAYVHQEDQTHISLMPNSKRDNTLNSFLLYIIKVGWEMSFFYRKILPVWI